MKTETALRELTQDELGQVGGGVSKTLAIVRMLCAAAVVSGSIGAFDVAEKQLQTAKDINNGKK